MTSSELALLRSSAAEHRSSVDGAFVAGTMADSVITDVA
jgi:hypothetical protein